MSFFLFIISFAYAHTQTEILKLQNFQWPAALNADERAIELWRPQRLLERQFRKDDGKMIFENIVKRDAQGFREVPDTILKKKLRHHVFILGCSYTFGIGVDDPDTFAAHLSKHLPHTRVVNMGVGGGNIVEPYYLWKNFHWNKIYPEEEGLLIYTYIPDHLERLARTWRYLQWAHPLTPYYSREGRELFYQGLLTDSGEYKVSQIINDLGLTHWWLRGISHFIPYQMERSEDQMAFYFSKVREEYLKQFPKGRFVVTWYAHTVPWGTPEGEKKFRQAMANENIEVWETDPNWDHFQSTGAFSTREIPGDGHPSAFANVEYGLTLAKKIKSTTTQMVH